MSRHAVVLGLLLGTVCALMGSDTHATSPRNVVIVTLDTTRADYLPAYGFRGVMPTLDRLAAEGTTFDNAESVAPLTLPAHTSIFTGLYPPHHRVRDNLAPALDVEYATLAEVLRAQGFHTGAFVGSAILRHDRGLARGFDEYDDGTTPAGSTPRRRSAAEVVDAACAWINGLDQKRFLLWVHLYDAHAPQTPPLEFQREHGDNYQGAIAYMDAEIGRVLRALRQKRLDDYTAILIAADHGESLGEHGEREHGIFLYEGALHVPLIVRVPGGLPRRVPDLVSLVDAMPTVLDLLGLPARPSGDGRSLLPAIRGERLPTRVVYAESMYAERFGWSPLRMVRDARMKFIDAPRPELYDLAADSFEDRNLAPQRAGIAAAMGADIAAIGSDTVRQSMLGSDTLREFASLGYVSHGPPIVQPRALDAGLDPKDYIHIFNDVTRARSSLSR